MNAVVAQQEVLCEGTRANVRVSMPPTQSIVTANGRGNRRSSTFPRLAPLGES